ncbi:b, exonuclease domain protein, DNA polymerase family [Cooperia oncophora]
MSPHKKRPSALAPDSAAKRRKRDEEPVTKGVFEAHLEQLSQTSEADSISSTGRSELEDGLGTVTSIAFQVFDIETYHEPGSATRFDRTNVKLYGVTHKGNSSLIIFPISIFNFQVQAPERFAAEHLDVAQRNLNNAIATSMRRANSNLQLSSVIVDNLVHLSIVNGENIYYYRGSEKKYPFIKVSGTILALNKAKQELKTGGISFGSGPVEVGTLFEANIDAEVKFMAHSGIVGCGWVEIPVGKGKIVNKKVQSSRCQLEVEVKLQDLVVHDPEGEWGSVAPIRTMSFDIECMGRRGIFPNASEDPVIQIANMVKVSCRSFIIYLLSRGWGVGAVYSHCFVLGTCDPVIVRDIIKPNPNEAELLEKLVLA